MAESIYKILENNKLGRFMAANRKIKQGETILKESPVLLGPLVDGCLYCFNCCKLLKNFDNIFCVKCNTAVLCTKNCLDNIRFHSENECQYLSKGVITSDQLTANSQIITAARFLFFKHYNSTLWQTLMSLEPHLEARRNTPVWRKCKVCIEDILKEFNVLSNEDLATQTVQKICGILDVNTFEVRSSSKHIQPAIHPEMQCLRGLYPKAALMAHDCVGNTHLAVDDDYNLVIHASVDIEEDQAILFNYSSSLQGTFERQRHLLEGKYFVCDCKRCQDPTEMSTELSTMICPRCKKPSLRSSQPGSKTHIWRCSECKNEFKNTLIKLALLECKRKIRDTDPRDLKSMEKLLRKFSYTLGPQHYLILEMKQNLAGLYNFSPPNKLNLSRKIQLCQDLHNAIQQIEPGISRMQGITLYELALASVNLAHKEYTSREISDEVFLSRLKLNEASLKEAIRLLLYEPQNSPEGKLAQNALMELKRLRQFLLELQKDVIMNNSKVETQDTVSNNHNNRRRRKKQK